jgi:hypothetical protein
MSILTRLNGWQRIGIVLSVVWVLGAGLYQRDVDLTNAAWHLDFTYSVCAETKTQHQNIDFKSCLGEADKNYALFVEGSWGNVVALVLVPVVLAWLLAYIIILVGRWVRSGFAKPPRSPNGGV